LEENEGEDGNIEENYEENEFEYLFEGWKELLLDQEV
jgi:hypothetical protein